MTNRLCLVTLAVVCVGLLAGMPAAHATYPNDPTLSDWGSNWVGDGSVPAAPWPTTNGVWDVEEWSDSSKYAGLYKMSGNEPDWWLNPWSLPSAVNMRIGWDSWAYVETRDDHEDPWGINPRLFDPDLAYLDFPPSDAAPPWGKWMWNSNITKDNYDKYFWDPQDPSKGIKVIDGEMERNLQADLEITNNNLRSWKQFYLEAWFTSTSADAWQSDLDYLTSDLGLSYEWGPGDHEVESIRSGWDTKVEGGVTYAVYYEELKIIPQPNLDKIMWHFWPTNPDADNDYAGDIYMKRLSVGTTCTPEPSAFFLLMLGAVPFAALRRRK